MTKRICIALMAAGLLIAEIFLIGAARAEDTIKIGFIAPSTGQFAQIGNMMIAGAKYFVEENGTTVAGKKIELIIKDDGGQPDNAKRIAQEFIVNDKVAVLAGFTFTPVALAVAPLATEAKDPAGRDGGGDVDHHRKVALYRAHLLYHRAERPCRWRNGRRRITSRRS